MNVLNQFEFWSAVPAGGFATYGEIVQATKLPEEVVRHILRYAFAMRLFAPVGRDSVKHTAPSAYISRTPPTRTMIAHNAEEVRISDYCFPESLRRFSLGKPTLSQEINESGWASLMSTRPVNWYRTGITLRVNQKANLQDSEKNDSLKLCRLLQQWQESVSTNI
ncbi:hypothetical protein EIK77_007937 [Talaromyces pinophilus]|nr:hypothetical protein EIK77_007937 [Talaromyces pinophilus]